MTSEPIEKKYRGISPIWTLPIIAVLLCAWLLYKSYLNAGVEIVIYFDDASGITPGKTQIMSMGIPVGMITDIHPELEMGRVRTTVKMERDVEEFLVDDTIFWIVRPEISAARVYGLDTILSGSYIGIQPGQSQIERLEFNGLSSPPPISEQTPGLHFTLKAKALHSLQEGSAIFYKNIQIGTVESYALQEDDSSIHIKCFIEKPFAHLVKNGSRFSNASGITVSGKLTNLKVQMESLSSLIMGGILLQTPDNFRSDLPVKNGHSFPLYKDLEAANYGLPMTLKLASGNGIVEGVTKVMYRGIEAGFVKTININDDSQRSVTANILLDPRAELILRKETIFWLAGPELSSNGIKNFNTLFSGPFITFQPGEGEPCDHFEISSNSPALEPLRPGRSFSLILPDSANLNVGSPILFKNIQVGEVIDISLQPTTANLISTIYIYDKYLGFVSTRSLFWNTGGIKAHASVKGLEVESGPLASILKGGVSFITPEIELSELPTLPEKLHNFILYNNKQQALDHLPELKPKGVYFQISSPDMSSISVGAPILYKKIEVGKIASYKLVDDYVLISCFIKPEFSKYLTNYSRFFNISGIELTGGLSGITFNTGSLDTIIAGGIGLINLPSTTTKSKKRKLFTLYSSKDEALESNNTKLTVTFQGMQELSVGCLVKYRGIALGKVTNLNLDKLPEITADVQIKKKMEHFFRETTEVWLVTPEVALSGVKNLDTMIFGAYITIEPGNGKLIREYTALPKAPPPHPLKDDGLNLILKSKHLGSLNIDAPIYYRQIQVGKVTGFELDKTFQNVLVFINIDTRYVPIIREETKFWNASGAKIEGGIFSGITVQTESLESIVRGGIALATPDQEKSGGPVQNLHQFTLHETHENNWLDWSPDIILLEQEDNAPPQISK